MNELVRVPDYIPYYCPFLMIGFICHFWSSFVKIRSVQAFEAVVYWVFLLGNIWAAAWVIDAAISRNVMELTNGLVTFVSIEFLRQMLFHLLGGSFSRIVISYIYRSRGHNMRQRASDR